MKTQRTSFNLNYPKIGVNGRERVFAFVRNARPTTFLTMDGHEFAKEVYDTAKDVGYEIISIYRRYGGGFGDEGDLWRHKSPADFVAYATHGGTVSKDVWIYVLNEPDASWNDLRRLGDWLVEVMHLLAHLGYRGVIGNFPTASIEPYEIDAGYLDNFLKVLGEYSAQGKMLGGWHEYTGILIPAGVGVWSLSHLENRDLVQPQFWQRHLPLQRVPPYHLNDWYISTYPTYWHILRHYWFDLRCIERGFKRHKKVITEGFWDRMPDWTFAADNIYERLTRRFGIPTPHRVMRGQKTLRNVWKYYFPEWSFDRAIFEQLQYAEAIYDEYVIGWNLFTWSVGTPDWDIEYGFNLSDCDELMALLATLVREVRPPMITTLQNPLPENDPLWAVGEIAPKAGEGVINVRYAPTTANNVPFASLREERPCKYATKPEWGSWAQVKFLDGAKEHGYITTLFTVFTPTYGDPDLYVGVPFVDQVGADAPAANDCGGAAYAMLVRWYGFLKGITDYQDETVPDVLRVMNIAAGKAVRFADFETAQQHYGLPLSYTNALTVEKVDAELEGGRPVLALVQRGKMPELLKLDPFAEAHYIVIVGKGKGFYMIHDPLGDNGKGANQKVAAAHLRAALDTRSTFGGGSNNPNQGLVFDPTVTVPDERPPFARDYEWAKEVIAEQKRRIEVVQQTLEQVDIALDALLGEA